MSVCICLNESEREQHKYRTARKHARRDLPPLQTGEMSGLKSECVRSTQQTVYYKPGEQLDTKLTNALCLV